MQKSGIHILFKIVVVLLILSVSGCAARRNTALNRTYHSVTAKYNVLFNGSESFKEGLKKYEQSYTDNYALILPVFIYGNLDLSTSIKPEMDRTIEKSSKLIKLHSITAKPEAKKGKMTESEKKFYSKNEYNTFVDDAYLLMGRAFFYQADYTMAAQTFEFIIKQFDDEKSKYLAYNWLVRTNVQRKDFREAQQILEIIQADIRYPDKLKYQLNLTWADYYLKQQNPAKAEPYVKEAIEQARKKKDKLRLNFIYAQINEKLNKYSIATDYYEQVIKMNPPYEMAFNAKIKRASMFSGGKTGSSIKAELLKMLKDDKNKEFLDQIYYALGDMELKGKNTEKAVEYFQLSTKSSVNNQNQKGLSYFALADIFFNQLKYRESQAYSDSAIALLDPVFPGYSELARKNKYLSKLVENLKTVEFQDSVQKVAKMPEKDRLAFIQKIIEQLKIAEKQELEKENMASQPGDLLYGRTSIRPNAGAEESGKWYFYNPNAKSFGEPEFRRLWGTRKLEDNWRRSNKQVIGVDQTKQPEISDDIVDPKKGLDNKKPEYYLIDLPLNDSLLEVSHSKIQNALYNIGEVYRNDLMNYDMAIKAYKDLVNRYQVSSYKAAAYYSLYKLYLLQNDPGQADIYKSMIIGNYPESNYAKVLLNPEFFKEFEKESTVQNEYYQATLNLYNDKKYAEVINRCDHGLTNFKNPDLEPKFKYIKILSLGKMYGLTVLKTELEKFIAEYPKGELNTPANELLAAVRKNELKQLSEPASELQLAASDSTSGANIAEEQKRIEKLFTFNANTKHYFVLIIDKKLDLNQLKFNTINFNLDFFIQKDYNTESQEFNKFFNSVVVKDFTNSKEGMDYYNTALQNLDKLIEEADKDDYQLFIISVDNYNSLIENKTIREYLLFYKENYLKK
jgi:tetratricopeptide (TPR) repeat protein